MYGWYGNYYLGRDNYGELLTNRRPPSVEYISARNLNSITIDDETLTFNATIVVLDTPDVTVVENRVLILQIALGALSSTFVVFIIVFIVFYQRLKKKQRKSER